MREPAIAKDLKWGPVFFRLKKNALKAKAQGDKYGVKTRIAKTTFMGNRWKLDKV